MHGERTAPGRYPGRMATIGVRELRQYASRYLDRVQAGETISVSVRGTVVARLVPASGDPWEELVAAGHVRPASGVPLAAVAPVAAPALGDALAGGLADRGPAPAGDPR